MKKDIILIGGGGHCRSCIDIIEQCGDYSIKGIIDKKDKLGQKIFGYEIIGTDSDLPSFIKTYKYCLVTIGQIKRFTVREDLFFIAKKFSAVLPVIVSPRAYVSPHATIKEGTIIMHDVTVNAGASVGYNCIINSKSLIEHDAHIGNHCHISTGTIINGEACIGDGSFIGSNVTVTETRKICTSTIIGAGTVVIRDIHDAGTYVGNPAQRISSI